MIKLREKYNEEIMKVILDNLGMKSQQNKNRCLVTTMCKSNIISLVDGNLEEKLKENFVSQIKSMKKIEYDIATH